MKDLTQIILADRALALLHATGRFYKEDVLRGDRDRGEQDFSAYANRVQWDFIRDHVATSVGEALTGVTTRDDAEHISAPWKVLPGARRKTIGYVRASHAPELAGAAIRRRYNQAAGTINSLHAEAVKLEAVGVVLDFPVRLERLELPKIEHRPIAAE